MCHDIANNFPNISRDGSLNLIPLDQVKCDSNIGIDLLKVNGRTDSIYQALVLFVEFILKWKI